MCLYDGSQRCSVCGEEEGSKNRSLGNELKTTRLSVLAMNGRRETGL